MALALILSAAPPSLSADPAIVDFGGSRKIRGEVTTSADAYRVSVTFLAVGVFDTATNDEVNRELGREYAARALARHLSRERDVVFELAEEEVREARRTGDSFRFVVNWPRGAVRLSGKVDGAKRKVSPAGFSDKFFTAKQDHLDVLAAVNARNAASIRLAREQAASAEPGDRRRVLARGVTKTEELGDAAFDALAGAVKKDVNLLDTTERPELLSEIASARKKFVADLRAALEDPILPAAPAFKGVEIEKPFDAYLLANPLMMEVGGAVIVEAGEGEYYLVGVAKTLMRDASPEDALRAERVTTLKARVAAIGERDGAKITYLKRVEDRVVVVKDRGDEKVTSVSERLKVTEEAISGVAKNLPVVGRWRSADGKAFYLAVGGKILPTKK